jgi:hypothetical protein
MSKQRSVMDRLELIDDVFRDVVPLNNPHSLFISEKEYRQRQSKLETVRGYCNRFVSTMESDAPFESEAEAIQKLAPVTVWFIGWLARRFAIMVIKAAWRRWHSTE